MSLLDFEKSFASLRMNVTGGGGRGNGGNGGGRKSPHKVAMMLAVIELIAKGEIKENRIYFNQALKDEFTRQFLQLAGPDDRNNPHLPFFHLRTSGFWFHQIKPGKLAAYEQLDTASGPGVIEEHIAYAYLSDELFELLGNSFVRNYLKTALLQNLSDNIRSEILDVGNGWDWLECEAAVQVYFEMLSKELAGQVYSKAEYRRGLQVKLNNRSEGSIEFKHQNISAILIEMGQPYIKGYKPAANYQYQLRQVVLAYLAANQQQLELINAGADLPVHEQAAVVNWSSVLDLESPELVPSVKDPERAYLARKINFSERERRNRSLGAKGEAFVMEFERFRLEEAGRSDLVKEVEWRSKSQGDGLGYDIRSFNPERDEELFIEVKTTSSGKYQPFYISENELQYSKEFSNQYSLYRVYEFRSNARLFRLEGAVDQYVHLQVQQYKASFS